MCYFALMAYESFFSNNMNLDDCLAVSTPAPMPSITHISNGLMLGWPYKDYGVKGPLYDIWIHWGYGETLKPLVLIFLSSTIPLVI